MKIFCGVAVLIFASPTATAAQDDDKKTLSDYVVDVAPGAVTAGTVVGLTGSAITTVHTSQDLLAIFNPFSNKDSKSGVGISITPARVKGIAMPGQTYRQGGVLTRSLANLTINYGQNYATISGTSYKKTAYSADTYLYLHEDDDPVLFLYQAYRNCKGRIDAADEAGPLRYKLRDAEHSAKISQADFEAKEAAYKADPSSTNKASLDATQAKRDTDASALTIVRTTYETIMKRNGDAEAQCDKTAKSAAKWNATRLMVSYADGNIEPDLGGRRSSLGRTFIASGVFELGTDVGLNLTYQHVRDAVDLGTLSTNPVYSNSNLAAVRITSGMTADATLHVLAEVSNASGSKGLTSTGIYRQALGIDKKIANGLWLQLRYGKSTTSTGSKTENKGLLNLTWVPSSTLFTSN